MVLGLWVQALRESAAALREYPDPFFKDLPTLADSGGRLMKLLDESCSKE